jgi:hypothetical protein
MMKPLSYEEWLVSSERAKPGEWYQYIEYLHWCNSNNLYCIAETLNTLLLETQIVRVNIAENVKHA